MKPPKCKICGKEHYGLCGTPADQAAAKAIVDALAPMTVKKGDEARKLLDGIADRLGLPKSAEIAQADLVDTTKAKPLKRKSAKYGRAVAKKAAAPIYKHKRVAVQTSVPADAPVDQVLAEGVAPPKPARKGNRHKPGYMAEYMRKRRAAAKEGKK